MKLVLMIVTILLGYAQESLAAPATTANPRMSVTQWLANTTRPAVIAHRGCWQFAPENSLKGLKTCIRLGADMVEGDIRTTKDGVLVIMHDSTLDRMTNMSGELKSYTYNELKRGHLREGSGGKDAPTTNETIPSLADMLRTASGHLFLVLHINDADVNQVFDVVSNAGAEGDVLFLLDAAPDSPLMQYARFIGKSAYMPIIFQCDASSRKTNCYTEAQFKSGQAEKDYKGLHPIGYMTASNGDLFLKEGATAQWRDSFKIVANGDEGQGAWAQYVAWKVPMILTDNAKSLIDYLKAK